MPILRLFSPRRRRVFGAGCLALLASLPLLADNPDWVPALAMDGTVLASGDQPLRIALPADMPAESLAWLALELDGVDVSEIVVLEQQGSTQVVTVTPPQALAPGDHELRLVEYTPAGDILERGLWTLSLAGAPAVGEAARRFFAAEFLLDGSYRVADNEYTSFTDAAHGQGAATIQASSVDGGFTSEAYVALLYDSYGADIGVVEEDEVVDDPTAVDAPLFADPRGGREVELAEYRLSTRGQNVSAIVGHHAPVADGLLVQNFHRRGLSVTARSDNDRLVASGFAFRTEPVSGFRYGAGIGDSEHRVAGSMVSVSPLATTDALTVSATYLRGEGEDHSGLGVAGDDIEPEGDGYSLALASTVLDRRLELRLEHAQTRYDFDGGRGDFDRTEDDAESFLGLFHVWRGRQLGERQANWNIGFERKEIGLFFRSLANPSLPFDRKLERLFSVFSVGGLSMQLQVARETDNVREDDTLPTLHNELASFQVSWSPYPEVDESGQPVRRWYGQPTLSFVGQYSDQLHQDLPAELAAAGADRQVATYQGGVSFQYERFFWGLNYGYSVEKDFGFFEVDNRHRLTDLSMQWLPAQRLSLGAQLQYNSVHGDDAERTARSYLAGVDARLAAFDDRLTTTFSYSVNENGARDDSIDARYETASLRFDWLLRPARENRPAWTLWLQGERQVYDDGVNPEFDTDPWQVFVGARMDWSLGRSW